MDLPKNVTQIGEANCTCKIYVEDYVVSYLKQLNPLARDKTMAAALYGRRKTEDGKIYLFVYGAGKLDFLQKETKHLSQAQNQEIERIRRQHFGDYEFLGYRILDGEMVEGFHVWEQETCRYVSGYAQFYEKNEAMLSYMLESRQAEAAPEKVNYEKYDAAKNRQEKRRAKYVHRSEEPKEDEGQAARARRGGFQIGAAAVIVLLCALGVAMNSSVLDADGFHLDKLREELTERKLPELAEASGQISEEANPLEELLARGNALEGLAPVKDIAAKEGSEGSALERTEGSALERTEGSALTDGGSTEAALQAGKDTAENASGKEEVLEAAGKVEAAEEGKVTGESKAGAAGEAQTKEEGKAAEEGKTAKDGKTGGESNAEDGKATAEETKKTPETYVVRAGDTLTGISIRAYGSEKYIQKICQLNSIKNPDEIKIGQKILLP